MKYLIAILAFSTFAFAWVWVFVLNIFIILGGYRSIRRRGYYPVASSLMLACIVAVTNLPIIATFVYLRMLAISSESIWSFSGDLLVLSIGITLLAILPGLACASLVYLLKKRTARVSGPRVIRFPLASRGLIAYGYLLYASIIAVGIFGIYFSIISPKAWYQWAFIVTGWTLLWFSRGREVIISGTQYKTESSIEGVTVTDLRPPVMFLRSFAAESDPFVHAPSSKYPDLRLYVVENAGIDEKARYTQEVDPIINIPLEQYLGATFRERIGPFVALGNPEDYVPPQGASRTYADDEGWYEYFTKISKQAACMVMPVANSSNLEREMTYIRREGLQQRLFIVTTPTKIFQPKTSAVMYKFGELLIFA